MHDSAFVDFRNGYPSHFIGLLFMIPNLISHHKEKRECDKGVVSTQDKSKKKKKRKQKKQRMTKGSGNVEGFSVWLRLIIYIFIFIFFLKEELDLLLLQF